MGGGRQYFYPADEIIPGTAQLNSEKGRHDGRNLIKVRVTSWSLASSKIVNSVLSLVLVHREYIKTENKSAIIPMLIVCVCPEVFSVETRRCAYQSSYDVQEWSQNQQDLNRNSAYVWNAAQLRQLDIELTDSILGKE